MQNFYQSTYDGQFYYEWNPDGSLTGYDLNADGSVATDASGADLVSYDSGGYVTGMNNYGTPPSAVYATSATFPPPPYASTAATGGGTGSVSSNNSLLSQAIAAVVGGIAIPGVNSGSVPGVVPVSSNLTSTSSITMLLIIGAAYFIMKGR